MKSINQKAAAAKKELKSVKVPLNDTQRLGTKKAASFPIIGIGASAGGLEALELFLKNIPEDSNLACVIVQHLDPTHKGIIVELLQRATTMKVLETKDRTRIQPNCVYVIPPNKNMSILHRVLHLLDFTTPRGLRLPIDFFFRSLADDLQERSLGVILSGMGTDGTLGIKAIKEKAGVVFVQEPANAKFDGMPRSAIDTGSADIIAPVNELPGKIIAYLKHIPHLAKQKLGDDDRASSALEKIIILLRSQTGQDFSLYKKSTVYRRIERRMGIHQIDKITTYVHYLQENIQEIELLFNELLIGVTSFFRDPEMWENLKNKVLPSLVSERFNNQTLRAWVPACSTGEEAYSLAIIYREVIEKLKPSRNITLQLFATDLDRDAVEKAQRGFYPENIVADVSPTRIKRFFIQKEHGYEISKTIREMVIFAPQNLIMDPPFTRLDILSCRNLLIYLTPELQKKLIPLFHLTLNPGGILVLGSAETPGSFTDLFKPVVSKSKIYRRSENALDYNAVEFPASFARTQKTGLPPANLLKPPTNIQSLAEQLLLQSYSPAAILTNKNGDIIYISGRTGKYLEPAAGKANWNIFAMAREGLRYELSSAFQNAVRNNKTVKIRNIIVGTNGGTQALDLTVQPIKEPEALKGNMLIVFTELSSPLKPTVSGKGKPLPAGTARVKELELELEQAGQEIQSMREEMQTSQEELKSANEELQSTNEELQSMNEELTTSKEEMQSMNEELQTVNHELQSKVDELTVIYNDVKNLFDSTDIGILFLDQALQVRRFTNQMSRITKLIASDIGRPITDIASELFYSEFAQDANQVLQTLLSMEKEIYITSGTWYLVRILPYRTVDNKIDGVVVTYRDITTARTLETKLRLAQTELEKRFTLQAKELEQAEEDLQIEKLHSKKEDKKEEGL
jgi:chemotaxis methyl-accepting protein methylase